MKKYVAYGPGFSGDYDTLEEAREVLANNWNWGESHIYVRLDLVTDLAGLLILAKKWKEENGPIAGILGEPNPRV